MARIDQKSCRLDISLFHRYLRGERQKDLAVELGVSDSRIHQRIQRARDLARAERSWDGTPERAYWETEAGDGVTFTSEYKDWPGYHGDYIHETVRADREV
jgi:hypothetical protein